MKKYLTLLAASLILSQVVTAQKVKYSLISDDPGNYKKTSIGVSFANLDFFNGFSIGVGGRAETVIKDHILAYANYSWAWVDQIGSEENYSYKYPEPKEGRKGYTNFTIGCSYFLLDMNSPQRLRITLKKTRMGRYEIEHYTMIPGTVKHLLGIDAGFSRVKKPVKLDFNDSAFHYQSLDNSIDLPLNSAFVMGEPNQPAGNPTTLYTTSSTYNIYLGARYRNVRNLFIAVEDLGKRSNTLMYDVYADFVYSPQTTVSHVVDQEGVEWKLSAPAKVFNHVGYKIGVDRRSGNTCQVTYHFEIGKIPGVVSGKTWAESGGHVSFGMTLAINSRLHFGKNTTSATKPKPQETAPNPSI